MTKMSHPLEQLAEIFWDVILHQMESAIQERVDAALAVQRSTKNIAQALRASTDASQLDRTKAHFISTKDLIAMLGLSRSTISNLERVGKFPKRVRLTPYCVRYKVDEIRDWEKSIVEAGRVVECGRYARSAKEEAVATEKLMRVVARRIPKPLDVPLPYYRMKDIMRITAMTNSQIYDGVRVGTFPRWMESGHRGKQRWERKIVDEWIANRAKHRSYGS